jgi:hypothetical protein
MVMGVQGWDIARLWFYLLGSAMAILIGVQLVVSWIVLRVLEELSVREMAAVPPADGPGTAGRPGSSSSNPG